MNRNILPFLLLAIVFCGGVSCIEKSATDLVVDIYNSCLSELSTSCIKPKALSWISEAVKQDEIKITEDLSIIKTGDDEPIDFSQQRSGDSRIELFDKIDSFLTTHALKLKAPEVLKSKEARALLPKSLLKGGLAEGLQVPLTEGNAVEGRGFVRKVMIPFLLGLKFKTFVLVPIALALIALKAWKATTLGLLSLVLSGALVIFKLAKPKVINYEVLHYPHHAHLEHHIEHIPHHIEHLPHHIEHLPHHIEHLPHHIEHLPHHVEHHVDHIPHHVDHIAHVEHISHPPPHDWEHHGWSRQLDAQDLAYAGQV